MNSKQKIAETAFQLFTQNGYKATSIAQLVTNSGLSKGAFYHYYKSKQAVYEYIIDFYFLSYYREFDWTLFKNLSLEGCEKEITKMYTEFVSQIQILTQNNTSKYFVMFFEAYNNVAEFKSEVQTFYTELKSVLSMKCTPNELNEQQPMKMIAKFEGLFFWIAIFPEDDFNKFLNN